MITYHVLYNPHAGNGRGKEAAYRLATLLPDDIILFQDITEVDDYGGFFDSLPHDDRVVIAGGDGTLNRFINDTAPLIIERNIYYFATGSGNDFLTDIGGKAGDAPRPINQYLQKLPSVYVNGTRRYFLNGIGFGIDGYCCLEGDKQRKTSTKPVNYSSIAVDGLLFHYKPTAATVVVDGVKHTYEHVWLAPTMNGRYYGGGMIPTPQQNRLAQPQQLSVMVFHCTAKLKALAVFPSIFKGAHIRHTDVVEVLAGTDIEVAFDRPTPLQIDGETVPNVTAYHAVAWAGTPEEGKCCSCER